MSAVWDKYDYIENSILHLTHTLRFTGHAWVIRRISLSDSNCLKSVVVLYCWVHSSTHKYVRWITNTPLDREFNSASDTHTQIHRTCLSDSQDITFFYSNWVILMMVLHCTRNSFTHKYVRRIGMVPFDREFNSASNTHLQIHRACLSDSLDITFW